MKILVAGAGSIGTVIGVLLAPDHEVTLLRRVSMGDLEIRVTGVIEETATLEVISSAESSYDLILLTCQSQQTEILLQSLDNAVSPNTTLVSLQNGVDNLSLISKYFPDNKIEGGLIWWSATLISPELVYYHREAPMILQSKKLCKIFHRFNCELTNDLETEQYRKLVLNVVSPVLAMCKLSYPEGLQNMVVRELTKVLFEEAYLIVSSLGYDLNIDRLRNFYRILRGHVPESRNGRYRHKVSTQIGLEKYGGQGSNVDVLLGKLIELDRKEIAIGIRAVRELVISLPADYDPVPLFKLESILSLTKTYELVELT